jgi:hypothetical protein
MLVNNDFWFKLALMGNALCPYFDARLTQLKTAIYSPNLARLRSSPSFALAKESIKTNQPQFRKFLVAAFFSLIIYFLDGLSIF